MYMWLTVYMEMIIISTQIVISTYITDQIYHWTSVHRTRFTPYISICISGVWDALHTHIHVCIPDRYGPSPEERGSDFSTVPGSYRTYKGKHCPTRTLTLLFEPSNDFDLNVPRKSPKYISSNTQIRAGPCRHRIHVRSALSKNNTTL